MKRSTAGIIGGAFIAVVIALQHLFMGRAVIALSVGFCLAFVVFMVTYEAQPRLRHGRILLLYGIAIVVQAGHVRTIEPRPDLNPPVACP